MWKELCLGCAMSPLVGCTSLSTADFYQPAGGDNKVSLVLIQNGQEIGKIPEPVRTYVSSTRVSSTQGLDEFIKENCRPQPQIGPSIAAAVVPILASAGKLIFDFYMESRIRAAEQLKKMAQNSYSYTQVMDVSSFKAQNCALLIRYDEKEKSPGLIALIKFKRINDRVTGKAIDTAFVVEAPYVRANNATVITQKPTGQNPASINVAIAVSIKTVGVQQSKVPGVFPVGEGVVSIPNVGIGSSTEPCTGDNCPSSDLIPYPEVTAPQQGANSGQRENAVSITVSVAEAGKIGVDLDKREAELKAVKEALGPAIETGITERLKQE